jgi:hypothetical protein
MTTDEERKKKLMRNLDVPINEYGLPQRDLFTGRPKGHFWAKDFSTREKITRLTLFGITWFTIVTVLFWLLDQVLSKYVPLG